MNNVNERKDITVKYLRERAKLTQAEVAEQIGIGSRSYGAWEREGAIPHLDKAVRFAKVVNASLQEVACAFGLDTDGIPDDSICKEPSNPLDDVDSYQMAANILANRTPEELKALFNLFGNKKGGSETSSN